MKDRKNVKTIVVAGIILLVLAAAGITAAVLMKGSKTQALTAYWSPGSTVAQSLRDYVSRVTNPKDPANYIPEKDRIAVFDMDGTLT